MQHMRKVVAYTKRHLAQEGAAKKNPDSKSAKSLRNWGHVRQYYLVVEDLRFADTVTGSAKERLIVSLDLLGLPIIFPFCLYSNILTRPFLPPRQLLSLGLSCFLPVLKPDSPTSSQFDYIPNAF